MIRAVRKTLRLKTYNYSEQGLYFITICTEKKAKTLAEIIALDGHLEDFSNNIYNLTTKGKLVTETLDSMSVFSNKVDVLKYVVMPNHVHIILKVNINGEVAIANPNNEVSKFVGTFKRFVNRKCGYNIWQRSFNDRIIRNEQEYRKIWQYVDNNVQNWASDCFYIGMNDIVNITQIS